MNEEILKKIYEILLARKNADVDTSYGASLYKKGTRHITDKVREEAEETITEALNGDSGRLCQESADLIFHLLVLWADQNIRPEQVFCILEQRFGTSGHNEKAARKNHVDNKIP